MLTDDAQLKDKKTHTADASSLGPKTMVRSLLGLPQKGQMVINSSDALPPGEFRYKTASANREKSLSPDKLSDTEDNSEKTIKQQPTTPVYPRRLNHKAYDQHSETQDNRGKSPVQIQLTDQQADNNKEKQSSFKIEPDRKTTTTSSAPAEKSNPLTTTDKTKKAPRAQQEIEVPGISKTKQVFSILSEPQQVDLGQDRKKQPNKSVDLSPDMNEPEITPLSEPNQNHPDPALATSGEGKKRVKKLETTTSKAENSLTALKENPPSENIKPVNSVAKGKKSSHGESSDKLPKKNHNVLATAPHPADIDHTDFGSPAVFTPQATIQHEGTDKIKQLRQSFHELMTKKLSRQKEEGNKPAAAESFSSPEEETMQQPAIQQVVVIQRNDVTGRGRRQSSAYWERSYTGRSWLKTIR